jgi:hypothetical protein
LLYETVKELSATGLGRFWSQPTGAAYREDVFGNPQLIRYGVIGSADISGIVRGGRRFECEIKTGNAKQEPQQRAFQAMIEMFGGIYYVARSSEDAVRYLKSVTAERDR